MRIRFRFKHYGKKELGPQPRALDQPRSRTSKDSRKPRRIRPWALDSGYHGARPRQSETACSCEATWISPLVAHRYEAPRTPLGVGGLALAWTGPSTPSLTSQGRRPRQAETACSWEATWISPLVTHRCEAPRTVKGDRGGV